MQLKQLATSDSRFDVAGMEFVRGQPTYRMLPGTVGESFALAVAERLQLPQFVIDRANELLDSETRQMGDLLRDLERQKELVEEQFSLLQAKQNEIEAIETKMREDQIKLEKKQLSIRREEVKKFAAKLEEKEKVLEDVLERLKSDPSRRIIAKSWDEIKVVKREALKEAENIPGTLGRKNMSGPAIGTRTASGMDKLVPLDKLEIIPEIKVNDRLVVCKEGPMFGREGVVIKVIGNKVEVLVNNLSVVMKVSQLALPTSRKPNGLAPYERSLYSNTSKKVSKAAERAIASERISIQKVLVPDANVGMDSSNNIAIRTGSNTVNVLGCNLMEAQERIKNMISTSLGSNRKVFYILHGHGNSGILKTKIRAWLKQLKLVKRFAPAEQTDGGDAFTQVDLL
jgi:DNA mismatch repair protein MutS2